MNTNNFPFQLIKPNKWYKRAWIKTTQPIEFYIEKKHIVPVDFKFDGASVPRIFRWLFSPYGGWMKAACVHDWCYKTHNVSKRLADRWFYHKIIEIGCPKIIAWSIWLGLQLMGWLYWFRQNQVKDI